MALIGAFTKLRKKRLEALSRLLSVRPPARMQQLGSHWTNFNEIRYFWNLRKPAVKIQVSLKYENNKGYFIRIPTYIYNNISLDFSYNEKYFRQKL
jgi:hypothetical protein